MAQAAGFARQVVHCPIITDDVIVKTPLDQAAGQCRRIAVGRDPRIYPGVPSCAGSASTGADSISESSNILRITRPPTLTYVNGPRERWMRPCKPLSGILFELENGTIVRLSHLFVTLETSFFVTPRLSGDPHRHDQANSTDG
jgi:hypothetical protein